MTTVQKRNSNSRALANCRPDFIGEGEIHSDQVVGNYGNSLFAVGNEERTCIQIIMYAVAPLYCSKERCADRRIDCGLSRSATNFAAW